MKKRLLAVGRQGNLSLGCRDVSGAWLTPINLSRMRSPARRVSA